MRGHHIDPVRAAQARLAIESEPGKPLKQVEAARLLDVHPITLNRIENGRSKVSSDLLERMTDLYGCSREWLLGEPEAVDELELAREKMTNALAEFSDAVDLLQRRIRTAATADDTEAVA